MIKNNIAIIANYLWKGSINNINQTLSNEQMRNFNINDYYYLTLIYQLDKPNFGQLAKKLSLTKPAISALVKRLEKNELITKIQSDEDKRVYHLNLTPKAIKIIQGDNEVYFKLSNILQNILTNEQITVIDDLLEKVIQSLNENIYLK